MDNKFAENLICLRETAGMTQTALALRMNVSRAIVGVWERGYSQPTAESIVAVARIFQVTTDELLGVEEMYAKDQIPKLKVTEKERALLAKIQKLTAAQQQRVEGYIDCLIANILP